ncbi:hypothetical protein ACP4OV_023184 [Aristida adscensionis]
MVTIGPAARMVIQLTKQLCYLKGSSKAKEKEGHTSDH